MKEKLIQYCDLKKEVEKLEERIEKIRKQSDLIADVVQKRIQRTYANSRYRLY